MVGGPASGVPPRFEILGALRVLQDGRELDLGSGKQRAVLAVLLLGANRPVPSAQIVDAVWGEDPPANGANVVQKHVAGLRRILEPHRSPRTPSELLTLTGAGYQLRVAQGCLDAGDFRRAIRAAGAARTAGDTDGSAAELRRALGLWRGDPLAGIPGPYFDAARERLAETRGAALESWAEIELDLGQHARLLPEVMRLVDEYPVRERLRYAQMLALYRCGRQAEALAAFRDARAYLSAEFGVEPGAALQRLHTQILNSDPSQGHHPPQPNPALSTALVPVTSAVPHAVPPADRAAAEQARLRIARRRPTTRIVEASLGVVVAAGSLGFLACAVALYHALRRRTWPQAAAAGVFATLAVITFVALGASNGSTTSGTPLDMVGTTCLAASLIGGSVYGAFVPFSGSRRDDTDPAERARRELARQIAERYPAIARELGIGRPDQPGGLDTGGLVDANSAPEAVLAAVPSIGPDGARWIVAERSATGGFVSLTELTKVLGERATRPLVTLPTAEW
ncbi:MAG: hypothetical protein QOI35_2954 [Cryptosporangiaceae bacterium]|nr:hypothetical protein [Cryptosporangiaceae bacterium]